MDGDVLGGGRVAGNLIAAFVTGADGNSDVVVKVFSIPLEFHSALCFYAIRFSADIEWYEWLNNTVYDAICFMFREFGKLRRRRNQEQNLELPFVDINV